MPQDYTKVSKSYYIFSRLSEVSDPYLKEKWKMTEANIKSEIMTVVEIFEMCQMFKVDLDRQEDKNRRESEMNNNILMRDFKNIDQGKSKNSNNNIKSQNNQNNPNNNQYINNQDNKINNNRWERFGGKAPFEYLNEKDEETGNENERFNKARSNSNNQQVENVVIYKKPGSSSSDKKDKDPIVWDPPEDKKKIISNNVPSQGQKNSKVSNAPNKNKKNEKAPVDAEKRRNYEKPWKLPEEKKNNNQAKEKESKSSFLLHCYPDGVGPDSDLIEMLEREVVDTNPNVRFEDIAELDKAKNVLKEAVLLPLLMPDYFKVRKFIILYFELRFH